MQRIEAGALILTGAEAVALARIVAAGLPIVERVDGGPSEADRALVAQVIHVAQQAQLAMRRSGVSVGASSRAAAGESHGRGASSAAGWHLGTAEAATLLGVSETYVRRLAGQRRLRAGRDQRGAWRFELADVVGLLESRTAERSQPY